MRGPTFAEATPEAGKLRWASRGHGISDAFHWFYWLDWFDGLFTLDGKNQYNQLNQSNRCAGVRVRASVAVIPSKLRGKQAHILTIHIPVAIQIPRTIIAAIFPPKVPTEDPQIRSIHVPITIQVP
jgi:hypothetical protein